MKTFELTGAALDYVVAECEGVIYHGPAWTKYSTDWAQGGPIIEREGIWLQPEVGKEETASAWYAVSMDGQDAYGPTPLIAAMRCYVASKLGDDVTLPPELEQIA